MLKRLFARRRASAPPEIEFPAVDPEGLTYVVGDAHGRADLLRDLLRRIHAEAGDWQERPRLVFLGDYVDRGEQVRETLDLLIEVAEGWRRVEPVFLMGNHERMLLDFLERPEAEARWFHVGGLQTLASYGIGAADVLCMRPDLVAVRDRLDAALGPHRAFVEATRLSYRIGNLLCVHAAADPALPAELQTEKALLWGHREFFRTPREDGLWTIHGHVIVPEPKIESGRISIDTGAYHSDRLTAARISRGQISFLTT